MLQVRLPRRSRVRDSNDTLDGGSEQSMAVSSSDLSGLSRIRPPWASRLPMSSGTLPPVNTHPNMVRMDAYDGAVSRQDGDWVRDGGSHLVNRRLIMVPLIRPRSLNLDIIS